MTTRLTLKVEGTSHDGVRAANEYLIRGAAPQTLQDVKRIANDIMDVKSAIVVKTVVETVVTQVRVV